MSAQTRNDSRYERQAHAHVFGLTTSPRVQGNRARHPIHKLRWNRDVWGSSPPKQSLFHRNFGGTRQSGGAGHVPESVPRFGASEWDAISAIAINRKLQPVLSPYSGMHFPPRASTELQPTIRSKSGLQFPRPAKERRQRLLAYSPSRAFSGVIGSERT